MTTGEKLRILRKEKHITQAKLAELCMIPDSAIRKYESDIIEPKLSTIVKLAKALDESPASLLPSYFLDACYDSLIKEV